MQKEGLPLPDWEGQAFLVFSALTGRNTFIKITISLYLKFQLLFIFLTTPMIYLKMLLLSSYFIQDFIIAVDLNFKPKRKNYYYFTQK